MNMDKQIRIAEIQRFCMHDGPGVRTVVFFKGCPLRCAWCHNPETQKTSGELLFYQTKCIGCGACADCKAGAQRFGADRSIDRFRCIACGACTDVCPTGALTLCGALYSVAQLAQIVARDRAFYGTGGGVTLSGGEPLMQDAGAIALLEACRADGISTAVETCGCADAKVLAEATPLVDLFLWDVKDTDPARHRQYTGVSCEPILENLRTVDRLGGKTRLRCILVNGVNTNEAHYRAVAELAGSLAHCEGVEWIPYHAYGGSKSSLLGLTNSGRLEWIPTEQQLLAAKAAVCACNVTVF